MEMKFLPFNWFHPILISLESPMNWLSLYFFFMTLYMLMAQKLSLL